MPRCPRLRLLRVRNKPSGASRASSPPGHADAATPEPVCQTRDSISSSPGARVCPGPPSFFRQPRASRARPFVNISFREHAHVLPLVVRTQQVRRAATTEQAGAPQWLLLLKKELRARRFQCTPVPRLKPQKGKARWSAGTSLFETFFSQFETFFVLNVF